MKFMHEDYEQNSFLFFVIVFQFLVDFILWRMKNKGAFFFLEFLILLYLKIK
jgi:hypothetical protein